MRKFSMPDWSFLILIIILSLAFFKVISPFILDIFIGAIIANQFWGIYKKLEHKLKRKELASIITVLITVVVIVIPIFIVGYIVSNEALIAFSSAKEKLPEIQSAITSGKLEHQLQHIPLLTRGLAYIKQYKLETKIYEKLPATLNYLVDFIQSVLSNLYLGVFHFFIILLLLFFMFTDGRAAIERIKNILPMNNEDEEELLQEIAKVTDGTIKGAFIVGLLEAVAGGIVFFIFGIPTVFFWSVIMFIAAIIPAGGSGLIYVPVGIFQLLNGHMISGIGLLVLAMVIPNGIQNIIKPKLVGNKIGLNPALLLVTTLGGMVWFGLIGFIIGPLIAALFIAVWRQFSRRYKADLLVWKKS